MDTVKRMEFLYLQYLTKPVVATALRLQPHLVAARADGFYTTMFSTIIKELE